MEAEIWADTPEYHDNDTRENRKEFPEGFTWDCCDGDGEADGCVVGRHRGPGSKRGRYASS